MMRSHSIGFRLTMWYFAVLAAALVAFGAGMWLAMRASLYAAVDDTLRDRVRGVARFIETQGASLSPEEMRDEFREHSVLGPGGDLFQVSDSKGAWLYRSTPLEDAQIPAHSTEALKAGSLRETLLVRNVPLRFLSGDVTVRGNVYAVQVAVSLHELNEGLDRFFWILVAAIPVILALASAGGYWMSRRALAPVDEITNAALSISAQSLSRRLPVPATADELHRLSSTLNAMFERLDAAFGRITRFTADASHELRTPIAFMRTTAEVALRKPRSETEYRTALAQMLSELEHFDRTRPRRSIRATMDETSATVTCAGRGPDTAIWAWKALRCTDPCSRCEILRASSREADPRRSVYPRELLPAQVLQVGFPSCGQRPAPPPFAEDVGLSLSTQLGC